MKALTYIVAFLIVFTFQAQDKEVKITSEKLSQNIHILYGQGGNIGVFEGPDHLLMIDSQFGRLSKKIKTTVSQLSDKPIKILLNTHHHGDHTGGNANFVSSGAVVYAHKNTRKRLINSIEKNNEPSAAALPVLTFSEELNLYIGDSQVMVFHPETAHTDTDAVVYFLDENVIHTGDVFFKNRYPFVDLKSGGSVLGARKAIARILMMINEDTQIIPGHGKRAVRSDLQNTLEMYDESIALIKAEILAGKTEDDVAANKDLTSNLDKSFYAEGAFISPERWRRTVYRSLMSEK